MFTNNCRDEVTLIFLKHKYQINEEMARNKGLSHELRDAAAYENLAIERTFKEVRELNAQHLQAGTYDAVAKRCEEFFKSIAAEPAQVG